MRFQNLRLFGLIALFLGCSSAVAGELYWSELFCQEQLGETEVRTASGKRVDCLTDTQAWEMDYASKFYQGVGQALYYGWETGREPALVLLVEQPKDYRYALQAVRFAAEALPNLTVKLWAPQFAYGQENPLCQNTKP